MRKTKIVCTLGPASNTESTIEAMLRAGMNIARLNFSHGTHESHEQMIRLFRSVRDRLGLPAAVMLDTKGPEVRVGQMQPNTVLQQGAEFCLYDDPQRVGDATGAGLSCPTLIGQVKVGQKLLIDDGHLELSVQQVLPDRLVCRVMRGGPLNSRKGLNAPSVHLPLPFLSEQDRKDLLFGIKMDVDFVAASFVRDAQDVADMRSFLDQNGGQRIRIIAKIESCESIDNFDSILAAADGIMVARGDLGVEVNYERLPGIQKRFIRRCYQSGKMVITATQMLDSMMHSATPTRAEITDVANAVFDGTSAVMLSGESAQGKFPVQAVQVMASIAEQAEQDAFAQNTFADIAHDNDVSNVTNAICDAACTTARDICARAIIAVTQTGTTARLMSKFRPHEPIVAATPDAKTYHQLALSWGVYPVQARSLQSTEELFDHAVQCALQSGLVTTGDIVVITGGMPMGIPGGTNTIKVHTIGQ